MERQPVEKDLSAAILRTVQALLKFLSYIKIKSSMITY
jgi:hypothetical protein